MTETGKAGESSPILTIGREIDGKNDPSACDTLEIWHFTIEMERHSRVSNQYLSALELGNVSRTANNEEVLGCAIDEIIRSRKSSLLGLEQMIRQYRGHLLETVEVEKGEL